MKPGIVKIVHNKQTEYNTLGNSTLRLIDDVLQPTISEFIFNGKQEKIDLTSVRVH